MTDELKSGHEILDDYFKKLKTDPTVNESLRAMMFELWEQKKLSTKTSLSRALDELRKKK